MNAGPTHPFRDDIRIVEVRVPSRLWTDRSMLAALAVAILGMGVLGVELDGMHHRALMAETRCLYLEERVRALELPNANLVLEMGQNLWVGSRSDSRTWCMETYRSR